MKIPEDAYSIVIIGQMGTGKTTLVKRIIYDNISRFKYVYVFNNMPKETSDYSFNEPFVVSNYDTETLKSYLEIQKNLTREFNEGRLRSAPKALFVIEDVAESGIDFYHKYRKFWSGFLSTSRHHHVTLIFVLHSLHNQLPPEIRSQISQLILFRCSNKVLSMVPELLPPIKKDGRLLTESRLKDLIHELLWVPPAEKRSFVYFDLPRAAWKRYVRITPVDKKFKIVYSVVS